MKFEVTTSSYVFLGTGRMANMPPIPDTSKTFTVDTEKFPWKDIWTGCIELNPDASLTADEFRKAFDGFMVFASGARDNYSQVDSIRLLQ